MIFCHQSVTFCARYYSTSLRFSVRRAGNIINTMCRLSWNLGVSNYWNPQGLSGPVQGLLYILCANWELLLLLKCSLKFWLDSCVSDLDFIASTSDIGNKLPGFARKTKYILLEIVYGKLCYSYVNCNSFTPPRHTSANVTVKPNISLKNLVFSILYSHKCERI